jgi:hypothetical protein
MEVDSNIINIKSVRHGLLVFYQDGSAQTLITQDILDHYSDPSTVSQPIESKIEKRI